MVAVTVRLARGLPDTGALRQPPEGLGTRAGRRSRPVAPPDVSGPAGHLVGVPHAVDVERLLPKLTAIVARREQPVTLIGWSLGGVIARQMARKQPDLVADIIALGSPLVGGPKFTFTAAWYARKGLDLDAIAAKVDAYESRHALPCPLLSIFTPHDGMVHPGASHDPHHPEVTYREVDASHLGLCVAPDVLEVIAQRLARP